MTADNELAAALWPDFYQAWLAGWTPMRPETVSEENTDD